MDGRSIQPREGIPAQQIFFALFLAIAVAGAGSVWTVEKAQKSASAVLAFNSDAAQHLDAGLMSAGEPAVALADSILTDSIVAGLAKAAHPVSPAPAAQIGEFRASLELTQPSAQELQVRFVESAPPPWAAMLHAQFLDIGTKSSAATANAVVRALAAWTPSHAAAPTPVLASAAQAPSSPAPAATPTPAMNQGQVHSAAPAQAPAPDTASAPPPVADGLEEVGALLSSADRNLDRVGGETSRRHRYAESSYAESTQQHLLKTQVNAAERELDQLRTEGATGEVMTRLRESQEAVRSILAGGHDQPLGRYGFNAVGISASELQRERAALRHAIGVVEQDRQAIQRIESAETGKGAEKPGPADSPGAAAPAPNSPAAQQAAPTSASHSSVQEQSLPPTSTTNSTPLSGIGNPLTVIRLASPPEPPRLWIPITVGLLCSLLYLGLAALAYCRADNDEEDQGSAFPHRFITPAGPVYRSSEPVRTAEGPGPEIGPAKAMPRRRSPFAMESNPAVSAAPDNAPMPLQQEAPVVVQEDPVTKKEEAEDSAENAAVNDRLWKILSETSIERVFEKCNPEVVKKPTDA